MLTENDLLKIGQLMDERLKPLKEGQTNLEKGQVNLEKRQVNLEKRQINLEQGQAKLEQRQLNLEKDNVKIKKDLKQLKINTDKTLGFLNAEDSHLVKSLRRIEKHVGLPPLIG